jgi:hypothetical protein
MRGGRSSLANLGLQLGEAVDFAVRGNCMQSLDDAESVRVRRQRLYLPGDVIVVRRLDHWNAHRFLGYAPSLRGIVALTQADDGAERDPAATVDAIVGRAQCEVTLSNRVAAVGKYARALIHRVIEVRQ